MMDYYRVTFVTGESERETRFYEAVGRLEAAGAAVEDLEEGEALASVHPARWWEAAFDRLARRAESWVREGAHQEVAGATLVAALVDNWRHQADGGWQPTEGALEADAEEALRHAAELLRSAGLEVDR